MKNLIVIDDFYQNPWAVRNYALTKSQYMSVDQLDVEFAGTESLRGFYSDEVTNKIQNALGKQIDVNPKNFSYGVFSKTYASDEVKKTIHLDGSDWTAVLYLSRPEDCRGGTVFYEHKNWGWSEIPDEETLQSHGYLSREDFINKGLKPCSQNFSEWRISARVGIKFNRLVLFRSGKLFHAAEGYFGNTDDDCRLLQLFFFKTKDV